MENIRFEVQDGIGTLTLSRPEKLNAYVPQMGDEIVEVFERAREDEAVRVLVMTGEGRGFCAGVDLEALKEQQAVVARGEGARLGEEDFLRKWPLDVLAYPKPVIAAVNGHAIGVGVTMILPCDLRIAAEKAKLGLTFAKLGILPGLGSTHLLPRLVGPARARELVLTGRIVPAPEAHALGLVDEVVPGDELLARVREIAAEMAEIDPAVLAAAKQALHFGERTGMAEAMKNEQELSAALRKR